MIPGLYEVFRHWADNGSVYILSDTHFGDADCKLMDPEWISPEKQISIINGIANRNDTFVCLGDVGDPSYASMIRAKKVLLLGNHDRAGLYRDIFNEIYDGPLFISPRILLSHEPVPGLPWCVNIHGHDHSGQIVFPADCRHLNLAANICGYTPVSLGKLIRNGLLSGIDDIHRITIDNATERKQKREHR